MDLLPPRSLRQARLAAGASRAAGGLPGPNASMNFDAMGSLDTASISVNISPVATARRLRQTRARPEGCCPPRRVAPLPGPEQARLVRVFKALADPTRLEILPPLAAQRGPTCVCHDVPHPG